MNEYKTILLNKINRRDARLAVICLGYVGLPLAVALARTSALREHSSPPRHNNAGATCSFPNRSLL